MLKSTSNTLYISVCDWGLPLDLFQVEFRVVLIPPHGRVCVVGQLLHCLTCTYLFGLHVVSLDLMELNGIESHSCRILKDELNFTPTLGTLPCVWVSLIKWHGVIWWVSPSLLDPLIQDRRVPIFRIESCLFSSDVLEAHYRKKPKTDLVPLKLAKTWHFSRSKTLSPCLGSIKTTSHSCIKCSQRTFRFY